LCAQLQLLYETFSGTLYFLEIVAYYMARCLHL